MFECTILSIAQVENYTKVEEILITYQEIQHNHPIPTKNLGARKKCIQVKSPGGMGIMQHPEKWGALWYMFDSKSTTIIRCFSYRAMLRYSRDFQMISLHHKLVWIENRLDKWGSKIFSASLDNRSLAAFVPMDNNNV